MNENMDCRVMKTCQEVQKLQMCIRDSDRTVGTQKESLSRERENRCKRSRSQTGKTVWQSEAVMRTELE